MTVLKEETPMTRPLCPSLFSALLAVTLCLPTRANAQEPASSAKLDHRVRSFLDAHARQWRDMNIPETDGKLLHDLIVKHSYTRALEIGTSTGHSSIWIAWALTKTGGKLVTIEIDEDRYDTALRNFREAGLSEYIDARLADAHELVPALEGPFDFVFSDADKDWYIEYFRAVEPKLVVGGCYTTHNVFDRSRRSGWNAEYVKFLKNLPNFETTFDARGGGLSISTKVRER